MNKKLGYYSSFIMMITTILFAFGMIINNNYLSFFVCMILSWCYIFVISSFITEIKDDRKAYAYAGMMFALIYAVFINLVYFTQITTVTFKNASTEILDLLSYESLGSLFFNLNLLGYGFMALSSFLIGVAMLPMNNADKILKRLLLFHILAFPGILLPILNIFNSNMGSSGNMIGVIVLLTWCAYFIPVCYLTMIHFKNQL